MRSAADIADVGLPDPAAVVQRMLSAHGWAASSFQILMASGIKSLAWAIPDYARTSLGMTNEPPRRQERQERTRQKREERNRSDRRNRIAELSHFFLSFV